MKNSKRRLLLLGAVSLVAVVASAAPLTDRWSTGKLLSGLPELAYIAPGDGQQGVVALHQKVGHSSLWLSLLYPAGVVVDPERLMDVRAGGLYWQGESMKSQKGDGITRFQRPHGRSLGLQIWHEGQHASCQSVVNSLVSVRSIQIRVYSHMGPVELVVPTADLYQSLKTTLHGKCSLGR